MPSRHPTRVAASALVLVTALTAGACSSTSKDKPGPEAGPHRGGSATIILGVEALRGLDPAKLFNLTPSGDANRMSAIFDLLFWADAATGKVNPGLGKSLKPSGDGAEWTMTLRSGVTFSDGSALDAKAVKFNYERIADPATKSPLAPLVKGATFTATGPLTLRIKLPAPDRQFDRTIATNLAFIGSPTAIRKDAAAFAEHPVGAGPFVLKDWVKDDHMTLTRNRDYFRPGRPGLDSVTFKVIPDPVQRINTVASGQAQAAIPGSELSFIGRAEKSGLKVTKAAAGGGPVMMFNTARAPFDDLRARRAIALALDLDDLAKSVDPGSSAPDSLYGPESPFHPASRVLPEADPKQAQQLLDELASDGKPLKFRLSVAGSPFFRRTAEYIQSRLSKYDHVKVSIEILDNAAVDRKIFTNRDFDLSPQIVPVADPDPNLYKLLHSDGQTNYMGYANPKVDAALEAGRNAADEAARTEPYATVEELVAKDLPILSFRNQVSYTVHSKKLTGLTLQGDGCLLFDRLGMAG